MGKNYCKDILTQIYADLTQIYADKISKSATICVQSAIICVMISILAGPAFAATQIPTTAVVNVAPEGQYAPVITVNDQTMREAETLDFEVLATDANTADSVHIEITQGQPPWLAIVSNADGNPARMNLRAEPPQAAIGRYRVFFKATDDSPYDMSTTKDIFIIVNPANNAPVITAENQTVQVGNTLTFTVNVRDPDSGDTVTLAYSNKPAWLNASSASPATGNPIDITFTGTPQSSDEGTYTMRFDAVDDGTPRQSASKEITIIVSRFNRPPVLDAVRNKEVPMRVKLEFAVNAQDPDGDVLTYSATGLPFSIGAVFNPSDRKFTWTPTDDQVGRYTVTFEVSDGIATDSEDITVFVSGADAPVFDPFPYRTYPLFLNMYSASVKVGKTLYFAVTAKDPNSDPITYGIEDLPNGALFDPDTHTFSWTPQPGQEGTYRVVFTASDGVYTTRKELTIFVQPASAPELTPVRDKYVRAGQTLAFTLNATDPDTALNQLSYSVSNNPPGSSLVGPDFTWTPFAAQVGTYRDVVFTVSDGTYSDSSTCWIFVSANGAPAIEPIDEKHVVEMRTLTFTVNAADPDGDALTYLQPLNAPKGSAFDPQTRTFTWTPAIGERGIYNDIIFRVTDGINTAEEAMWIFVAANDAPIVEPVPEQHIKAGRELSFAVSAYDPNGDDLVYSALNLPIGAEFLNRTFRWTPQLSQIGVYNDIIFEVTDGVHVVAIRTWIFVEEPGAPVMERVGDKFIIAAQEITFTVSATDPDGDPLTYSATNLPPGSSFDPDTRAFTWTPTIAQVGTYPRVFFHVTDGMFTDTEECWMFVRGPGAPTIELPGDQRVRAGNNLEFTVTATDPDTAASGLTYTASNLPLGAVFSEQVFRWTPTIEQVGTYPNVQFTVSDGTYSDSGVLWIIVTAPGAPEFAQDITTKNGRINEPLIFAIPPADDPDHSEGELTYYGVNMPGGAEFSNRTFRWTPATEQAGTYKNVRLEVRDPDNNIDSDIFWLFIAGNSPPELDFIGTKYGTVGQPLTFTISATDFDNDTLTFSASNLPDGAAFNPDTRTFTWTPSSSGTFTGVHFEVSDGRAKDSEDITIIVAP